MTHLSCAARSVLILFCVTLLLPLMPRGAMALSPSNTGLAGLWEYPTAQHPGDGAGWMGLSDCDPYQTAYADLGFLPWLEANLRLTRFETGSIISEGYGRYKDKAMDFKVLLFRQEGWLPSVAVGALDMTGTEKLKAYFGVATYELGDLALSLGYGTDRLNGFYGGFSWQAAPWLELKAEYSPLDYTTDYAGTYIHPDAASSEFNYGFVATLPFGADLSVSRQRGEEWCLGLSYRFDLSRNFFGSGKKPLARRPEEIPVPDWKATDLEALGRMIVASSDSGLGLRNVTVHASPEGKRLLVSYENVAYTSQARAMAGLAALVAYKAPWDISTLSLVACVRGEPVVRADIPGEQLALLRLDEIFVEDRSGTEFFDRGFVTSYGALKDEEWTTVADAGKTAKNGRDTFSLTPVWEPRIDRSLDEDYMDRWSLDAAWRHRFGRGFESFVDVRVPLDNDVDLWWQPEMNDETRLWKGVVSYGRRMTDDLWVLGELGWLDDKWAGANVWGRWYFEESPWWIGLRASVVHERDPGSFAGLSDRPIVYEPPGTISNPGEYDGEWWTAGWVQAGYHEAELNLDLMAEGGQFIDGDTGFRASVTRHWDDISIGAWVSRTDRLTTDRNYSNAGLYLEIPAEFWTGRPSGVEWTQEFSLLSTWRLYAARQPGSWMPPEKLWEPLLPARLGPDLYHALAELTALARGEVLDREDNVTGLFH